MNEEILNKRTGKTIITSVSVSPLFNKFLQDYNISPSEAFRKGVAVTLFDLGVSQYQSQKNEDRAKFVEEFLKRLDNEKKLSDMYEEIKKVLAIYDNFETINKLIGSLTIEKEVIN